MQGVIDIKKYQQSLSVRISRFYQVDESTSFFSLTSEAKLCLDSRCYSLIIMSRQLGNTKNCYLTPTEKRKLVLVDLKLIQKLLQRFTVSQYFKFAIFVHRRGFYFFVLHHRQNKSQKGLRREHTGLVRVLQTSWEEIRRTTTQPLTQIQDGE